MSKQIIDDQELELVSGGTITEINEIADIFKRYGYEESARALLENKADLSDILFGFGFNQELEICCDAHSNNRYFKIRDGASVSHQDVLKLIDDCLFTYVNK